MARLTCAVFRVVQSDRISGSYDASTGRLLFTTSSTTAHGGAGQADFSVPSLPSLIINRTCRARTIDLELYDTVGWTNGHVHILERHKKARKSRTSTTAGSLITMSASFTAVRESSPGAAATAEKGSWVVPSTSHNLLCYVDTGSSVWSMTLRITTDDNAAVSGTVKYVACEGAQEIEDGRDNAAKGMFALLGDGEGDATTTAATDVIVDTVTGTVDPSGTHLVLQTERADASGAHSKDGVEGPKDHMRSLVLGRFCRSRSLNLQLHNAEWSSGHIRVGERHTHVKPAPTTSGGEAAVETVVTTEAFSAVSSTFVAAVTDHHAVYEVEDEVEEDIVVATAEIGDEDLEAANLVPASPIVRLLSIAPRRAAVAEIVSAEHVGVTLTETSAVRTVVTSGSAAGAGAGAGAGAAADTGAAKAAKAAVKPMATIGGDNATFAPRETPAQAETAAVAAATPAPASDVPAGSFNVLVFLGSARNAPAKWGGDARLGDRVLKYLQRQVAAYNAANVGAQIVLTVLDPLEITSFQSLMNNPTFFRSDDDIPADLKEIQAKIKAADGYIVVTPEYNHTIPPALLNAMDNFGGSNFAFKPSACVCYSKTALGGSRVAQALQPFLHELGCLPVSKQVILPAADQILSSDGVAVGDKAAANDKQMQSLLNQFTWWAEACRNQRASSGIPA